MSKRIIKEVVEDDGSTSYETTVINPVYMPVINENGLVIINNEIYQYSESGFKIIHDGNPEKIRKLAFVKESNSELGITVVKLKTALKGYGHTFNHFLEKTESSRKRASFRAYFYMGANGVYYDPATCMSPSFYIECKAQKKNIWGNWVYKNNYTPITEVSGSWTYRFTMVEIGNPFNIQYIYSVSDPNSISSPLFYTYFNGMGNSTNYFKATCVPDGDWFCAPSGWLMDECIVYNYDFRMKAANNADFVFSD